MNTHKLYLKEISNTSSSQNPKNIESVEGNQDHCRQMLFRKKVDSGEKKQNTQQGLYVQPSFRLLDYAIIMDCILNI